MNYLVYLQLLGNSIWWSLPLPLILCFCLNTPGLENDFVITHNHSNFGAGILIIQVYVIIWWWVIMTHCKVIVKDSLTYAYEFCTVWLRSMGFPYWRKWLWWHSEVHHGGQSSLACQMISYPLRENLYELVGCVSCIQYTLMPWSFRNFCNSWFFPPSPPFYIQLL